MSKFLIFKGCSLTNRCSDATLNPFVREIPAPNAPEVVAVMTSADVEIQQLEELEEGATYRITREDGIVWTLFVTKAGVMPQGYYAHGKEAPPADHRKGQTLQLIGWRSRGWVEVSLIRDDTHSDLFTMFSGWKVMFSRPTIVRVPNSS